jgi:nucleoredoxin
MNSALVAAFALVSLPQAPVARPAEVEVLALRDLANRPERWPAAVRLQRDLQFSGGAALRAGQPVEVLEFAGATLLVDGGNGLVFDLAPEDCDFVAAANQAWAKLTPAQRAVDAALLAKDASLWPERARCRSGFRLDDGTELDPGREYDFLTLEGSEVKLFSKEHATTLVADLAQTDLIARARERALIEPAQRPARIAAALKGALVDARGKPVSSAAHETASVYVLYFGASWCGPCRKFSPSLVKFAAEVGAANPKLAIALLSNDRSDADMQAYMQDEKMPWPGMPLATLQKTPLLLGYSIGSIPHLVVVDRHGKVLTSSFQGGRYVGPDQALKDLGKLLASGIAR